MKNIAVPGVLPLLIALMLALTAFRAHITLKQGGDKRYAASRVLCAAGTIIFVMLAIFQLME